MKQFDAEAARRLQDKITNKKPSWWFRKRFLKRIKEIVSNGCPNAQFEIQQYTNWQEIVKWLESLDYTCKVTDKYVMIYWDKQEA